MQQILNFILHNRLLMIVLCILLMATGYYTYRQLPIEAFPDVSPVLVQVFTETEGLAPEDVEKYVTYPIETAMNGLPKLKLIRSVSNFGLSVVNIYFEDGTDIYFTRQIVNERLQEAKDKIPEGFGEPRMGPISTAMGLVMFYYLKDETGQRTLKELRTIQDWIVKFQLQTVPGVTEVLGIGGYEKQYHVIVDPVALLRYNVTINDIIDQIKANNLNVGAQFIEKGAEEYIVRSVGLASSIKDIQNIVIKSSDGTPIYLYQIASVKEGGAIRRGVQTHNGIEEVVAGMIIKLYGTNSSTVIGRVEKKMEEINKSLPKGIKIVPYYEQKTIIEDCVETVNTALFEGVILVIIILVLFIGGIRPSIVVIISMPFSILFATFSMWYFGISANLMSLGGLAISIGLMADASIVIVENIDRLLHESSSDEPLLQIITRACLEVVRPIFFAIIIIIVVFLPLFTLEGVEGKTFRPLAYTVALSMLGSLVYAILFAPVISSLLMHKPKNKTTGHQSIESGLTGQILRFYKPLLTYFVKNRHVPIILAIVFLAAGLFVFPKLGSEFTPELNEGTTVLRLTMPPSISLEESTRLTMLVERRITKIPEIKGVVTRIGRGEVGAHTDPINSAEMYILLKPKEERKSAKTQKEIEALIRDEIGEIPGVLTNFTQPIAMTVDELLEGVKADLAIKLFGDDLEILKAKADEIAAIINKIPGAEDVQVDQISGTPQLLIYPDRHKTARYGINLSDVQEVIKAAVGGQTVGQIFEGIKRFDIFVRFEPQYRNTSEAIAQILIKAPGETIVPLSQIATLKEIIGPRQITRENNQRFISVQCNVVGIDIGTFVKKAQKAMDENIELPPGYFTTWGGQFKLQQEANKRFAIVIPITLLLALLLLYWTFNSLKNSLLILINIPLALVGGVIALWVTGQNLSVPASVGFISLFGIALANGMVLVSYINQLLRENLSMDEASIRGACYRLRPVLITATAAGIGLVPLLFSSGTGSEVQRPLATVIIGGLIGSTTLTLLILPALYKWFSCKKSSY